MKAHSLSVVLSVSGLLIFGGQLQAEKKSATPPEGRETVAKPLSDKERRKQEEKLRKELDGPYRKWLNEDVTYIITDEERQAFKRLATDDERQQFHRAVLAAARSDSRHRRERVQGRALPPYRLRQRALRLGHSRLEDRPRPDLHHVWPAGRNRIASFRRHL